MSCTDCNQSLLRASGSLRIRVLFALGAASISPAGCGFDGVPLTGVPSLPAQVNFSNNWEMAMATTTKGSSPDPLSKLTGSIINNETAGAAAGSVTPVFRATAGCYLDATSVPMNGTLTGPAFTARSFGVKGQFLTLTSQLDATATHMSGTYSIAGGCSNGEAGTFIGDRYQLLTGTFTGSFSDGAIMHTVSLSITQSKAPTGDGAFLITGSGSMTNFPCFANGSVPDGEGSISGGDVAITLTMDGPAGIAARFAGRLSVDAQSLTINALSITGQGCTGSFRDPVLKRQ
jgi:hypothetical protein